MKILFDVGHGGADPGAVANGLRESECNLAVAETARAHLRKLLPNAQVRLTREDDRQLVAQQRIKLVRDFAPNICISVHHNSATTSAQGAEIFYAHKDNRGRELSDLIGKHLRDIGRSWRGAKTRLANNGKDYYYMIRDINNTNTVALLYEGAFLTNPAEANWLKAGGFEQQGQAIAKAIAEYVRRLQPEPDPASIVPTTVAFQGKKHPAHIADGVTKVKASVLVDMLGADAEIEFRRFAEALGYKVHYNAQTKEVSMK